MGQLIGKIVPFVLLVLGEDAEDVEVIEYEVFEV